MISPELLKALSNVVNMASDSTRCQEDENDIALVEQYIKDNGGKLVGQKEET